MFYVYILISEFDHKLYIGFTPNLKSRIKAHHAGYARSTKHRRPMQLIYYEAYLCEQDAKRREKYLKSGKGRAELKVQLKSVLVSHNYAFI